MGLAHVKCPWTTHLQGRGEHKLISLLQSLFAQAQPAHIVTGKVNQLPGNKASMDNGLA